MRTSSLIRWSGLAAMLGGAFWVGKVLYEMNETTTYARDITDYMFFVVPLLLLAGLTGLYALVARRAEQGDRAPCPGSSWALSGWWGSAFRSACGRLGWFRTFCGGS